MVGTRTLINGELTCELIWRSGGRRVTDDLVDRLRNQAAFLRGESDRTADLLEEAAVRIEELEEMWHDGKPR